MGHGGLHEASNCSYPEYKQLKSTAFNRLYLRSVSTPFFNPSECSFSSIIF